MHFVRSRSTAGECPHLQSTQEGLEGLSVLFALITSNVPQSEFVAFEIGAAWVLKKTTFPLVYKMAPKQQTPSLISDLVCTDLTDENALINLAGSLTKIYVKVDQATPAQMAAEAREFLRKLNAGLCPSPTASPTAARAKRK
jgi:hypothetical protein